MYRNCRAITNALAEAKQKWLVGVMIFVSLQDLYLATEIMNREHVHFMQNLLSFYSMFIKLPQQIIVWSYWGQGCPGILL